MGIPHIKPLTGLRFVAALMVVMSHFLYVPLGSHGPVRVLERSIEYFSQNGFVGVSFFFLLSGFILAYNYLDDRGQMRGGRRAFWVARIARISSCINNAARQGGCVRNARY